MLLCAKHQHISESQIKPVTHSNLTVNNIQEAAFLVHHAPCVDGFLAASLAWGANPRLKMIGAHPQEVRDGKIPDKIKVLYPGENGPVVYCDVCPDAATNSLVLDHHPVAATLVSDVQPQSVIFDHLRSGAALMWQYIYGKKDLSEAPEFVRAVDLYDRGQFSEAEKFRSSLYYSACALLSEDNGGKPCPLCYLNLMVDPEPMLLRATQQDIAHKKQVDFWANLAIPVTFMDRPAMLVYGSDGRYSTDISRRVFEKHIDATLIIMPRYHPGDNKTYWSFRSRDGKSAREAAQLLKGNGHGDAAGAETIGNHVYQYFS